MITCPDCHAENDEGAKACQACGRALAQGEAAGAALPPWLQQLKPEAEEDTAIAVAAAPAKSAAAASTDGLFAAQPPRGKSRGKQAARRDAEAAKGGTVETASLIGEDDLPAWLRAFGDNQTQQQASATADESWMVGAEADAAAANPAAPQNLAQSWQSPARPAGTPQGGARARSGAASIFAKPSDGPAKPERVIATPAAPPPTSVSPAAPEPEPPLRAANGRPTLPRPVPAQRERGGVPIQRVALIAFVAALVIFLIVVGIFLIGPSL